MRLRLAACLLLVVLAGCERPNDRGTTATTVLHGPALTMVSINLLHGAMCPADSNYCQIHDRVQLLGRHVTDAGCPQVVALQEVSPWSRVELEGLAPSICAGRYALVPGPSPDLDAEQVMTSLPVEGQARIRLPGLQRTALWVRVRATVGPIDVVLTHIGAGADSQGNGGLACTRDLCPPSCPRPTAVVACQVKHAIALLERHRPDGGIGVLAGDFNVVPGSGPYRMVTGAGLLDTYLAAGRPECEPASSVGCTGGREDKSVEALRDPTSHEAERIDYLFLRPGGCRPVYDSEAVLATGLFASTPVSGGPAGLAWPSDHVGTALDLACR